MPAAEAISVPGGSLERSSAHAPGTADDDLTAFHSGRGRSDGKMTEPHQRGGGREAPGPLMYCVGIFSHLTSDSSLKMASAPSPQGGACHPAFLLSSARISSFLPFAQLV